MPVVIPVPVALHLSARLILQWPVGVMVSQLAVEAQVCEVIAAEFVRTETVNEEIPEATEVGVFDDEVAAAGLAVALLQRWDVLAARAVAHLLQRCQNGLVCVLPAAFLQVWV